MESVDIAIGRLVVHIGEPCGAVLREAAPSERPRFHPVPTPILIQPSLIRGLVGRRGELAEALAALDQDVPVEISGPPGIGKTALLRHIAHHPRASSVDGVVYISARRQSSLDLRHRLFDAFYTADTPCRPTPADIRRGLRDRYALILLDDVSLTQPEIEEVFEAAPRCAFVIAARERILWGETRAIVLAGLLAEDTIALFERELERTLDADERAAATRAAVRLEGHPLRIRQGAALIRARGIPPDAWAEHLTPDTLIAELVTAVDEKERRVLLALAPLAGLPISLQHVAEMAGLTDVEPVLIGLARRGLVARQQSRYRLVDGVADRLRRTDDLKPPVNRVITYFTAWADRQRRNQASLLDAADALGRVQECAMDERRWGETLRFGRQLERPLVAAARWGTWGSVLERCLTAAKAIGDRSVEAWALHQLGTRAVHLADADLARRLLEQAAQLRDELGETAAAAVSRRNLGFIIPKRSDDARREQLTRPFDDAGDDDTFALYERAAPRRVRSSASEAAALVLTVLLLAALGGFAYPALSNRGLLGGNRTEQAPPAPAPAMTASPLPAPPPRETQDVRRANIRIFTARPGSIATKRPTDLCYAVSDAVQTRIEPVLGVVDAVDALTCRRVTPTRTTTYELTAVGRDGVPVSQQVVIVVR